MTATGARGAVEDGHLELRRESRHESLGFDLSRLKDVEWRGLGLRFAFGFAVSAAVGTVTVLAGQRVGGLFLAFPGILPASLTLIAEQDGDREAKVDAIGAVLGGLGLAAFGATSWLLVTRIAPVLALGAALGAWSVVAAGGYLVVRRRLRR